LRARRRQMNAEESDDLGIGKTTGNNLDQCDISGLSGARSPIDWTDQSCQRS
jgi:hypothetical protein